MDAPEVARRRLPDERPGLVHRFELGGHKAYIRVSFFEDGSLGELFFEIARAGSTLSGMADVFAIMVSKELQKGMTVREFVDKFKYVRFEPSGRTSNPAIPFATSLVDYIARWFEIKFLPAEEARARAREEALATVTVGETRLDPREDPGVDVPGAAE